MATVTFRLEIIGIEGIPEVSHGDSVAGLILEACQKGQLSLASDDILVVAHKIVSKAEGLIVELSEVTPSPFARTVAQQTGKNSRLVEVILGESRRIVRMEREILVVETRHGFICANGGVDSSNVGVGRVALLPRDPDASAEQIRQELRESSGVQPGIIISDSFGRPWREGNVDVALGVAGLEPLIDYRGKKDTFGYEMKVSVMAVADEIAAAGELVMGKTRRIPVALVRGISPTGAKGTGRQLIRLPEANIFR